MSRISALFKVIRKCGCGSGSDFLRLTGKKIDAVGFLGKVLVWAVLGISSILCFAYLLFVCHAAYPDFVAEGIQKQAMGIMFVTSLSALGVTMVPVVHAYFFMADEVPCYRYMPFHEWEIAGTKFLVVLCISYLVSTVILLPQMIGYGLAADYNISYWIICVGVFLFLPIYLLVIISLSSIALMHLCKEVKYKKGIVMGVSYAASFFILIGAMAFKGQGNTQLFLGGVGEHTTVMQSFHVLFPNIILAENALVYQSYGMLLLFLLTDMVSVILLLILAERFYLKNEREKKKR